MGAKKLIVWGVLALFGGGAAKPMVVSAQTRISIGVTETMETYNPYGDSVSLLYGIWCQVMGCLGTYDFDKAEYVGMLAEKWEVKDPNNWIFHLRKDIRRLAVHRRRRRALLQPGAQRPAEQAGAEHRAHRLGVGDRQIHRALHDQAADRAAAGIHFRPAHHHEPRHI